MYLVSIIIPIYNAEKYIEKTIQSIISQSLKFENIQLILIDDNSNDTSKEIIKKFNEEYENIDVFFSSENHGYPGFGRNMGLTMVKSKYVMFLDHDDEYDIDMCNMLYETIENENADVVSCNKISVENNAEMKYTPKYVATEKNENTAIIKSDDIFRYEEQLLWNKIYKNEIIQNNNIKFLEDNYADDFAFVIDYFLKSEKMIYLKNYYGYRWNIRSESISHTVKVEHIEELLNAYRYVCNKLKEGNKSYLINDVMKTHINHLIHQTTHLNLNTKDFISILKEINKFENEINFSAKIDNNLINYINNLILKEHYKLAVYSIKTINKLRTMKNN